MAFSESYIAHLLLKKITGTLTAEEMATLEAWRVSSVINRQKYEELTGLIPLQRKLKDFAEADIKAKGVVTRRIHFLRKWRWAAAVILLAGAGAAFWALTKKTEAPLAGAGRQLQPDIAAGSNKAVLTLADGSTIVLDSAARGQLAMQGNTRIVKDDNGKVEYDLHGASAGSVHMNSLSTPKGGQYQLTLPDGTNVWLNAASSITFPTAFSGSQRSVEITGEVYFEVTKRLGQPFIVEVNGRASVLVLGTLFNINGYSDEAAIQTTLIAGSVKVQSRMMDSARNDAASVILRPGQQAVIPSSDEAPRGKKGIVVSPDTDIEKVMAWKKGLFNFNGADVPTVMRQLERWYDIHVRYEGAIPVIRFKGELDRGVNLSEVLKILPEIGIQYRMEGRTLIVR